MYCCIWINSWRREMINLTIKITVLPGPTLIIPCPSCGYPGKKRTLISGNTFGAELWSDRRLPEIIQKCSV
jgi:hypothetical protein